MKKIGSFPLVTLLLSIPTLCCGNVYSEDHVNEIVINRDNAGIYGIDFGALQKVFDGRGKVEESLDVSYTIKFNEESTQVDVSDLDGISINVDIRELRQVPRNLDD